MGKWIELKPDRAGSIAAWRADPDSRPRAGMVVVQEIFGVNSHIRATADRFASVGYLAIAPAVFDRIEKGFDVGYDADSRTRGMAIVGKLDFEQTLRDVAAAIEVASEAFKVGIVGYCFGGSVVWAAAARLSGLSAAVGYYGGRILAMKDLTPQVPTELHFGRKGSEHPDQGGARVRRRASGGRRLHLSGGARFQLRPARILRSWQRGARLVAHPRIFPAASRVGRGEAFARRARSPTS